MYCEHCLEEAEVEIKMEVSEVCIASPTCPDDDEVWVHAWVCPSCGRHMPYILQEDDNMAYDNWEER